MAPLSRREWLLALLTAPVASGLSAQSLVLRLDGDFVHISAPRLEFLAGKILDRLHDAQSVAFLGQLSLSVDGNATIMSRSVARFAVSYDIWEEKFQVTLIQQMRRNVSHLSASAAQAWIVDSLALNTSVVPIDRPFWLRLELRVEDLRDAREIISNTGIDLKRLVEIFGRPANSAQPRWTVEAGPLHFADLRTRRSI